MSSMTRRPSLCEGVLHADLNSVFPFADRYRRCRVGSCRAPSHSDNSVSGAADAEDKECSEKRLGAYSGNPPLPVTGISQHSLEMKPTPVLQQQCSQQKKTSRSDEQGASHG